MAGRNYQRPLGKRRYKRMFILSAEGAVTERSYFNMFNNENQVIHIKTLKHKGSNPETVLREMERYLKEQDLQKDDEAWLVIDTDRWTEKQLMKLHQWSVRHPRYGFAVSNPQFEYWLLLHFEDGNGVTSARNCKDRLKRHLPKYDKCISHSDVQDNIAAAIKRAESKDRPPCADWPRQTGTTAYRLVKKLHIK